MYGIPKLLSPLLLFWWFFFKKNVRDIALAISGDGIFMITSSLNKCTFRYSNLCPYPYREPSYLPLVQQLVGSPLLLLLLLLLWLLFYFQQFKKLSFNVKCYPGKNGKRKLKNMLRRIEEHYIYINAVNMNLRGKILRCS